MIISGVSGIREIYPIYNGNPVQPVNGSDTVTRGTEGTAQGTADGAKMAGQPGNSLNQRPKPETMKKEAPSVKEPSFEGLDGKEKNVSIARPNSRNPYERQQGIQNYMMGAGNFVDMTV